MHSNIERNSIEVLMIIEGEIATTHLIERILMACGLHGVSYRKQFLSELKLDDFSTDTIPLFIRCADPVLEYWVDLLRRAKHPYLYYIDDNFWRIDGNTDLAHYYRHRLVRRSLDFAVAGAERVLTNSPQLSRFICDRNPSVSVLPAFFDFSLIDGHSLSSTEEVRIGFAGSSSREADLDIVRPLILPILENYPLVVFEFAGVMPAGIEEGARIRFFSHMHDYSSYIRFQAERGWAIGLAPLFDSEANRCKTDNKYREYGACRIAGIYSAVDPYIGSVKSGVTGILVENRSESWSTALNDLIVDEEKRRAIGTCAYTDVLEKYSVSSVSQIWASCFRDADNIVRLRNPVPLAAIRNRISSRMLLLRLEALWIRLETAYEAGGTALVMSKLLKRVAGR